MTDNNFYKDSNEMFYWLGFLAADGNFNYSNHTIRLRIHKQDVEHLEKFANFCGGYIKAVHGEENQYVAYLSNKKVFTYLVERFLIHSNKTKNPINIDLIPEEYKLAFVIGFIDGDGSIYTTKSKSNRDNRTSVRTMLKVQIDAAWLDELGKISIFLLGENRVKLKLASHKKSNVSELVINNHAFLKDLYIKVKNLGIPYLSRKWNKCDLIEDNFYNKKAEYYKPIIEDIKLGLSALEISKKYGITRSRVYQLKKHNT